MLDDLKAIHDRDAQDALGIAEKQAEQYGYSYGFNWQPANSVSSLVVAGMGGSGLAAKAARSWPGLAVPLEVVQTYELPAYINASTLLIASSYSGNTEETVSCLEAALGLEQRPMIIVIASGGRLEKMATDNNLPFVKLPGGLQPRMTFGYQLRALCEVLEQAGLAQGVVDSLNQVSQSLPGWMQSWLPTVPTKDNLAKQLAQECIGKSIVIYAGPKLSPAAYKWKISFNENAKHIAWWNQYPELNHNEFMGWTEQPVDKPYTVIELRSSLEHPQIQKRFEATDRLLSGKRPSPEVVTAQGATLLEQLVWTITLGDFVSLYTALLNGINPTPVDLIEKLKLALEQ